jgi:hypothetical protein
LSVGNLPTALNSVDGIATSPEGVAFGLTGFRQMIVFDDTVGYERILSVLYCTTACVL